ncbi:MAG: hypothetical protein J6W51_01145 [Fibrobacter sp.]|nr:hypothetical protein [Fibrobacter sp.]
MTLDEIKKTLPSSDQKDAYEQYQKAFGSPQIKKVSNTTMLGCMLNRIAGIPYLLVLVALVLPLFTVTCSEVPIAEFNAYEVTIGGDIRTSSVGSFDQFAREFDSSYKNKSTHYDASPWVAGIFVCVIAAAVFSFMNKTVHAIVAAGISVLYIWLTFLVGYFTCRNLSTDAMGMLSVTPGFGIFLSMVLIAMALIMNIIALTHRE